MIIYLPPNIVIILTIIHLALNCNDVYFDRAVTADDGNSVDENQEEFINLLRNSITSCIAELDGSPDRDHCTFRIDCLYGLYHTTLRFAEFLELDDSFIQLISDARDILFERNADAETVQTITCPQLFTGEPGRPKFEITEEILRFSFDKRFNIWRHWRINYQSCKQNPRNNAEGRSSWDFIPDSIPTTCAKTKIPRPKPIIIMAYRWKP